MLAPFLRSPKTTGFGRKYRAPLIGGLAEKAETFPYLTLNGPMDRIESTKTQKKINRNVDGLIDSKAPGCRLFISFLLNMRIV